MDTEEQAAPEEAPAKLGVSIRHLEGRVVFQIGEQQPAVMTPGEARKGISLIADAAELAAQYNKRQSQREREQRGRERREQRQKIRAQQKNGAPETQVE